MAKLLLTVLLASSLSLLPKQSAAPQNQHPSYDDAAAYEVYDAALALHGPWARSGVQTMAILAETLPKEMCSERPDKDFQGLIEPAISDYVEKNKTMWSLQNQFQVGKPYGLLSSDQLRDPRKIDHLGQYTNSFRYIEYAVLSAVGFNPDKTIAVLWVEYRCGARCGTGSFLFLQKKAEKWQPLHWTGIGCGGINY